MSYTKFGYELNEYLVNCEKNNHPTDNYEAIVRDKWISDKRYKELIAFILENWDSGNCDDFSRPFSKHLIDKKELPLFKQLWKGIIRNRLEKIWARYDYLKCALPDLSVEKIKQIDITGFNQFSANETTERRVA